MRQSARRMRIGAMALAMLFMSVGCRRSAQVTTGSVVGTVKDAQGGVVPGATVDAHQRNQGNDVGACHYERVTETSSFR